MYARPLPSRQSWRARGFGFAFPFDDGVRLRIDNRFLFGLMDGSPFQAGWFPSFAAEFEL
jgi:hypothetical protein